VGQEQRTWIVKGTALPRTVLSGTVAQVKKRYKERENRYGPRYTNAMLSVALITIFLPIPGSLLVGVAVIMAIAEIHLAISKRCGFPATVADLMVAAKT
jgi:hypothetical protein